MAASTTNKPITVVTRAVGYTVIMLVFLAGVQLFIFSEQTEQFFAWTIAAPLTAASLGAGYWAALVPTLVGIRGKMWANIRSIVIVGFTATIMMLITTLLHLDRFHHTQPVSLPWFAGWVWIIVYVLSPFMFLSLMVSQMRTGGETPPRQMPLPIVARVIFGFQAAFGLVVGLGLFFAPESLAPQWSWALTPLTARAMGTWLTASGVASAVIAWESDIARAQGTLYGLLTFGVLELIALLRYSGAVNWSSPFTWFYVVYMVSHVLVSGYLSWKSNQAG